MGCIESSTNTDEKRTNRKIENNLKKIEIQNDSLIRILLLGPGESGKSTIFKQLKLIQDGEFQKNTLQSTMPIIRQNIINQMKVLIQQANKLLIPIQQQKAVELINKLSYLDEWDEAIIEALTVLWNDPGIQKTLTLKDLKFHIFDSVEYFFNNLKRISSQNYSPTNEDILHCRVRTVGINQAEFNIKKTSFILIDVGGQRNERKKWIHCFENVTSVLFCSSLSGYCQTLIEDNSVNRMKEAINLFTEIYQSPWFQKSSIMLFLNKKDIFEKKIKEIDLSTCFRDYSGGKNYEKAIEFIQDKFLKNCDIDSESARQVYPFITCAVDTNNVQNVIESALDSIMRRRLKNFGMF
ncbi:guanine nucleotide-binding protein g(o) subunit alpha [Anaeramoeba flamelloides]|uniref:Guanine nucleotide-binding protein g(O) subunit alpha n=1 Tax=Anaeramoeba flamelloides TaxID=1746091 RepID=A0AAV7YB28_9EUKA|nr:guanine nucleotide-binding protein g(o) subunit alpha [Anaeramoeba flamelloides]